jgi:predicted N-formylglutamate amidohydrolase
MEEQTILGVSSLRYSAPMQVMSRDAIGDLDAFEALNPDGDPGFLVVCDHASNALPPGYDSLGLAAEEFERHIAYDIGAAGVARLLAEKLRCPAILARFSRLLIDLNRGADDPTLVMKLSDGAIIPANRDVDAFQNAAEFKRRLTDFYEPYHAAVAGAIARAQAAGAVPAVLSIHSFTPVWKGRARPWHAGILWDRDDRLPVPLLQALRGEKGLVVGDNEPYSGELKGDCLYRHGTRNGLPHVLIEIRQDLISDGGGQAAWAERIAALVPPIAAAPGVREVRHYGSRTDA